MKTLEDQIDYLAKHLPCEYEVELCIEKNSAWLQVVTPDLKRVPIEGDSETCWEMLLSDALTFCKVHDEERREAKNENKDNE